MTSDDLVGAACIASRSVNRLKAEGLFSPCVTSRSPVKILIGGKALSTSQWWFFPAATFAYSICVQAILQYLLLNTRLLQHE